MPKGESTLGAKNKLRLTLPDVPKESTETNHTENG